MKIPLPLDEVFGFFSAAENLDLITPPWLDFQIITPLPIKMAKHVLIDYSLKINGFRVKWKTEITHWDPPHCFVDEQIKGPYKLWTHKHLFKQENSTTVMEDMVTYAVPGAIFEPYVHKYFVRPRLKKIFDYREKILLELIDQRQKSSFAS